MAAAWYPPRPGPWSRLQDQHYSTTRPGEVTDRLRLYPTTDTASCELGCRCVTAAWVGYLDAKGAKELRHVDDGKPLVWNGSPRENEGSTDV
jgi:hypothetical protein